MVQVQNVTFLLYKIMKQMILHTTGTGTYRQLPYLYLYGYLHCFMQWHVTKTTTAP